MTYVAHMDGVIYGMARTAKAAVKDAKVWLDRDADSARLLTCPCDEGLRKLIDASGAPRPCEWTIVGGVAVVAEASFNDSRAYLGSALSRQSPSRSPEGPTQQGLPLPGFPTPASEGGF